MNLKCDTLIFDKQFFGKQIAVAYSIDNEMLQSRAYSCEINEKVSLQLSIMKANFSGLS